MEGFNSNPPNITTSNMSLPYNFYMMNPPPPSCTTATTTSCPDDMRITTTTTTTCCTTATPYFHYNIPCGHEQYDDLPLITSNNNPWMDSRIWSRLPRGLVDRIVAFLPPQAFFRARCVCKRWYALLYSTNFLQLYLHITPRRHHHHWFIFFRQKTPPNIYNIYRSSTTSTSSSSSSSCTSPSPAAAMRNRFNNNHGHDHDVVGSATSNYNIYNSSTSHDQEAYLFDPYELAWYRLSFPLIPPGFCPASSSGGLICWVSDDPGPKTLFLHNPIVGATSSPISITQLPAPTLRPRLFPSIGMTTSSSSSDDTDQLPTINITVVGDDLISPYAVKNLSSESFHVDGAGGFYSIWGTTSSLPRLCSLEPSGRMTAADGKYFCMNYSPFSVLAYDIGTNIWYKIQAPMRRFLRSPSLVESYGRLILVAAVEKSKLNVPKSLRLWSLQQQTSSTTRITGSSSSSSSWVEIERMPQQLYMQFSEIEDGRGFDCVGHGEFIIITIRGTGVGDYGCTNNKGLLFDMMNKRWIWMPPCPYNLITTQLSANSAAAAHELHGFAYEPKLATPVTALLDQLSSSFPPTN